MPKRGALSLYNELVRRSKNYLRELPPKDVELVRRYQEASDINSLLRGGRLNAPANAWYDARRAEVETLDRILAQAPTLPEDLVVHRAAPRGVYPGEEAGFLSTSFDKNGAWDFLEAIDPTHDPATMYQISVQNGTPFIAPHNLVEEYMGQKELIFPRGSMLLNGEYNALDYLRGKYAEGGQV
jgi:hypothetical protein